MTCIAFIDCETVSLVPGPATIWELALIVREDDGTGDAEYVWQFRPDLTRADPAALRIGGYYERGVADCWKPGRAIRLISPDDDTGEKTAPKRGRTRGMACGIAEMLSGATLVAANPAFDAGHLDCFLRANGQCPAWDYHLRDIGSMVAGWVHGVQSGVMQVRPGAMGGVPHLPETPKVADAARVMGIDPDAYEAHTALGDARLVKAVYDAVTGGGAS